MIAAADASATSLFTIGERFTLTAGYSDGTSDSVEIGPFPPPTLSYEGKLRDRVGRGETAISSDDRKDGTFKLTLPPGSGLVTSLSLDRGDGNRWNTVPNDSFWVLGVSNFLESPLLNNADGTLPHDSSMAFFQGGNLLLFAAEDGPEATSFFTAGKTFRLTVGFDDNTFAEASVTLTADDIPTPKPDLSVGLADAPDPVHILDTTVYSATVRNIGDAPATHVQIRTDVLPAEVRFASAESPSNCEQLSSRVVCTLDSIAVGAEKTVRIPFLLNAEGTTVTIGISASATEPDENPSDNAASATTTILSNLQLTLTDAPDPVHVGEDLTYRIQVTNPNATPEGDVQVFSRIPENTKFVSVSTTLCSLVADTVTCNFTQLDPGQSLPIQFVVRPQQAGTVENLGAGVLQAGLLAGVAQAVTTTVRPANDDFADRQQLTGIQGFEPGSNVNATGEALVVVGRDESPSIDPAQVTKSVWYEWTTLNCQTNPGFAITAAHLAASAEAGHEHSANSDSLRGRRTADHYESLDSVFATVDVW